MPTETRFSISCDAPHCGRVLEGGDGVTLFDSVEDALAIAAEQNWLVRYSERDQQGARTTYCPNHWHWQFGLRTPYWGRRPRRYR